MGDKAHFFHRGGVGEQTHLKAALGATRSAKDTAASKPREKRILAVACAGGRVGGGVGVGWVVCGWGRHG